MSHFIIKQEAIQLYDNANLIQISLVLFKQFEPTFILSINIKELTYYPDLIHQTIHHNGTIESLELDVEEYNTYINKIEVYQQLEQVVKNEETAALLPQTLVVAKAQVEKAIYNYAAQLQEQAVNLYCSAERDRWTTVILPEAQAYIVSEDPADAPNLTAQHIVRTDITDTNLPEFKAGLLNVITQVVAANEYLVNYANFVAGTRGKWLDVIRDFEQTNMETEKQAITRLLAIDYKIGWKLPT